jgi:GNAT superfamily N-acetyltransferase
MTKATKYVNHMYSLYAGRAAMTVGVDSEYSSVHPFVFENKSRIPIGLIALSADGVSNPADVDIYHISAFTPGKGDGSEILGFLCKAADEYGVRLCIQAEAQFNGKQTMTTPELIGWYSKFGFTGSRMMHREPVSQ